MSGSLPHAISSHSLMNTNSSGYSAFDQRNDDNLDKTSLNAQNARASSDLIVTLSEQGQALSQNKSRKGQSNSDTKNLIETEESGLTLNEKKDIEQLRKRDQEVRLHEQAHSSVGGIQTESPSYAFTTGPNGKQYVTNGEVSIDAKKTSNNPDKTIQDMEQVYRAALAPMVPSFKDRQAAAEAQVIIAKAQQEKKLPTNQEKAQAGDFFSQMV